MHATTHPNIQTSGKAFRSKLPVVVQHIQYCMAFTFPASDCIPSQFLVAETAARKKLQLYVCEEPGQVLHTFQLWCVVAHCQLPHMGVHWDGFMLV